MKQLAHRISRAAAPLSVAFLVFVSVAHAQTPDTSGFDKLGKYLLKIVDFIDLYVVPIIFALAFIVFIVGVYRYFIAGAANEEKRQEGQQFVMYGLIGFVIMLSVWGLINLLVNTLGFNKDTRPNLPTFNVSGSSATTDTKTPSFPTATQNTTSGGTSDSVANGTCPAGMTWNATGKFCTSGWHPATSSQPNPDNPSGLYGN